MSDDVSAFRSWFQRTIGSDARFLRVRDDSKAPVSSFRKGRRNFLPTPPDSGNFGVIPQGRLFVLDFDGSRAQEQVDLMSSFLGVDLRSSLAVISQSGGVHVYLRSSVGFTSENFPKASLRRYNAAFLELTGRGCDDGIVLDADVRSPLVLGYVIAPGSCFGGARYRIADESDGFLPLSSSPSVMELDPSVMSRFSDLVSREKSISQQSGSGPRSGTGTRNAQGHNKGLRNAQRPASGGSGSDNIPVTTSDGVRLDHPVSRSVLNRLGSALAARMRDSTRADKSFHSRRAFVKTALMCCHSDDEVADACIRLHIDRDTYRGTRLTRRALMRDITGFVPGPARSGQVYHGVYCERRVIGAEIKNPVDSEMPLRSAVCRSDGLSGRTGTNTPVTPVRLSDGLEQNLAQIRSRIVDRSSSSFRKINPRVVDPVVVADRLRAGHRRETQEFLDALSVLDFFIQPLTNVGAPHLILSMSALTSPEMTGLSPSRARQALRLLRSSGVIVISQRQRHGIAPSYSVPSSVISTPLTKALRSSWKASGSGSKSASPLYFDRLRGSLREVFTNRTVPWRTHDSLRSELDTVIDVMAFSRITDTGHVGSGASPRFLVSEARNLGYEVSAGVVLDRLTREPVEQSPSGVPITSSLVIPDDENPGRNSSRSFLNIPEVVDREARQIMRIDIDLANGVPVPVTSGFHPATDADVEKSRRQLIESFSSAAAGPVSGSGVTGRSGSSGTDDGSELFDAPAGSGTPSGSGVRSPGSDPGPSGSSENSGTTEYHDPDDIWFDELDDDDLLSLDPGTDLIPGADPTPDSRSGPDDSDFLLPW